MLAELMLTRAARFVSGRLAPDWTHIAANELVPVCEISLLLSNCRTAAPSAGVVNEEAIAAQRALSTLLGLLLLLLIMMIMMEQ